MSSPCSPASTGSPAAGSWPSSACRRSAIDRARGRGQVVSPRSRRARRRRRRAVVRGAGAGRCSSPRATPPSSAARPPACCTGCARCRGSASRSRSISGGRRRCPKPHRLVVTSWLDEARDVVAACRRAARRVAAADAVRARRAVQPASLPRAAEDAWQLGIITPDAAGDYLAAIRRSGRTGVIRLEAWLEKTELPRAAGTDGLGAGLRRHDRTRRPPDTGPPAPAPPRQRRAHPPRPGVAGGTVGGRAGSLSVARRCGQGSGARPSVLRRRVAGRAVRPGRAARTSVAPHARSWRSTAAASPISAVPCRVLPAERAQVAVRTGTGQARAAVTRVVKCVAAVGAEVDAVAVEAVAGALLRWPSRRGRRSGSGPAGRAAGRCSAAPSRGRRAPSSRRPAARRRARPSSGRGRRRRCGPFVPSDMTTVLPSRALGAQADHLVEPVDERPGDDGVDAEPGAGEVGGGAEHHRVTERVPLDRRRQARDPPAAQVPVSWSSSSWSSAPPSSSSWRTTATRTGDGAAAIVVVVVVRRGRRDVGRDARRGTVRAAIGAARGERDRRPICWPSCWATAISFGRTSAVARLAPAKTTTDDRHGADAGERPPHVDRPQPLQPAPRPAEACPGGSASR